MPITLTLYNYSELSEEVKKKAVDNLFNSKLWESRCHEDHYTDCCFATLEEAGQVKHLTLKEYSQGKRQVTTVYWDSDRPMVGWEGRYAVPGICKDSEKFSSEELEFLKEHWGFWKAETEYKDRCGMSLEIREFEEHEIEDEPVEAQLLLKMLQPRIIETIQAYHDAAEEQVEKALTSTSEYCYSEEKAENWLSDHGDDEDTYLFYEDGELHGD